MADSSDEDEGDNASENNEKTPSVIKDITVLGKKLYHSFAFMNYCYNRINGYSLDQCLDVINVRSNNKEFSKSLDIPNNTLTSVTHTDKNDLQFTFKFAHKKAPITKSLKIILTKEKLENYSSIYIEKYPDNVISNSKSDKVKPKASVHTEKSDSLNPQFNDKPTESTSNTDIIINLINPAGTEISIFTNNESMLDEMECNADNFNILKIEVSKLLNTNKVLNSVCSDLQNKFSKLNDRVNELETSNNNINRSPSRKRQLRSSEQSKPKVIPRSITTNLNSLFVPTNQEFLDTYIDNENKKPSESNDESNDELSDVEMNQISANQATTSTFRRPRVSNDLQQHNNDNTTNTAQPLNNNKKSKNVPPIVVHDNNQKRMAERIETLLNCRKTDFHFMKVNKNKYRIFLNSIEHYDKLIKYLKDIDIRFHTYTPPERKPINVIMRNIQNCYDEKGITESLYNYYKLKPTKIYKYTTNFMRQNKIESSMWRVQFEPGTNKKTIYSINRIGFQHGIIIEDVRNRALTQCLNCWRFEHTHTNCAYQRRCWFCDKTHEYNSDECTEENIENRKPWCVNCHIDTHSAISKDCDVYKRIAERRKKVNTDSNETKQKTTINANNSAFSNDKVGSYANAIKKNKKNPPKETNKTNNESPADHPTIQFMQQIMQQQQTFMEGILKQLTPILNKSTNASE